MKRPHESDPYSITDVLMAGAQSAVSRTPLLGRIVTHSPSPNFVRSTWRINARPADSIADWLDMEGDERSGRIPRLYRSAGIIAVNPGKLLALQADLDSRLEDSVHAVAYKVGNVALVSRMQARTVFGGHTEAEPDFLVAMRRGPEAVQVSAGAYVPEHNVFHAARGSLAMRDYIEIGDLDTETPLI